MVDSELARARGMMYQFLASMYLKEPDDVLLHSLFTALDGLEGVFSEPAVLDSWREAALDYKQHKLTTGDIRQEYYDIFFVPLSDKYVPAFESAIREMEAGQRKFGNLWGEETSAVAAAYEQVGFDPAAMDIFAPLRQINIPDHIGFEVAFMAYLCILEAGEERLLDAARLQKLQKDFLVRHLARWVDDYAAALNPKAPRSIYTDLARATCEFVQQDLRYLQAG